MNDWAATDEILFQTARWLNDHEVVRFSEQRHYHHTALTQWDYMRNLPGNVVYWGIYTGKDMIGTMRADVDWHNGVANLGILIGAKDHWGKGYGKEAWGAAINHLRGPFRKIEAGMMAANEPMIKTCLACGMKEEARVGGHFLWNGQPMDLVLMGTR